MSVIDDLKAAAEAAGNPKDAAVAVINGIATAAGNLVDQGRDAMVEFVGDLGERATEIGEAIAAAGQALTDKAAAAQAQEQDPPTA